jgi:hypothetical protein
VCLREDGTKTELGASFATQTDPSKRGSFHYFPLTRQRPKPNELNIADATRDSAERTRRWGWGRSRANYQALHLDGAERRRRLLGDRRHGLEERLPCGRCCRSATRWHRELRSSNKIGREAEQTRWSSRRLRFAMAALGGRRRGAGAERASEGRREVGRGRMCGLGFWCGDWWGQRILSCLMCGPDLLRFRCYNKSATDTCSTLQKNKKYVL